MKQFKKIILCADDFGLNPSICEGVLKLARMKRLSAVSCMVNHLSFSSYASELAALRTQVQVGLHFNLTEGFFLSKKNKPCFTLSTLLLKTHVHAISQGLIEQELIAQLECFVNQMGAWPDFIDGHQHVQHFPIVRRALLKIYEQYLRAQSVWVRATYPIVSLPDYTWKEKVLTFTGGRILTGLLDQHQIAHNDYFAGIYDFSPSVAYPGLFKQWLHAAPPNTLIMCHPAAVKDPQDKMDAARINEMAYFSSELFLESCDMLYFGTPLSR